MGNYKNSKIGLETAQKYGDILEMERPQTEESLRKHPRMTLQNRAKIFSPFSPLRGYDEQLAAEKQRAERVPKRILTGEEMSALSDRLMQVTKGMTITVRYFKEDTTHPEIPAVGNYITLTGKADRIDPVFRTLQVGDTVVPFEDLVEIGGEGILEIDTYQCNMRTVNPTRSFVLEHNMTQQLSCDAISIPEWKLELMAKKIFEKVWGNQNKAILRACKMIESCQNGKAAARMSAAPIQGQIEKIKKRKLNYAAMRADGELPREEYQALCKQADDEVARLEQELKALSPAPEPQTVSSDMKAIYDFLSQKVDVHGARLAPELIDQFVEVVTPIADYSYRWKLNTGCKKSKEERADLMAVSEKPILTFTIDFETAKRYREANKMPHQFRRAAWTDLTVEVYL